MTPAGVVTTLAGEPGVPGGGDGTNSQARFLYPQGVAVDTAGNLNVADTSGHTIRKMTPAGWFDHYGFQNGARANAYPGSGIMKKSHIQLVVRDIDCILAIFYRSFDDGT